MKRFISLLVFATSLIAAGCSDSEDNTPAPPPADVVNNYVPPTGKQVKKITQTTSKFTRFTTFVYDDLGRIKKTRWEQTTSDKTIDADHAYSYLDGEIRINDYYHCYLNEQGYVDRIDLRKAHIAALEYDEDDYLTKCTTGDETSPYDSVIITWTDGNMTLNTSGGASYSRTFTDRPNKTNLELTAVLTNAYFTFEQSISSAQPLFGTFGLFGKRCTNLPARDVYNASIATYTYEMDDDDCPATVTTEDGTYTIEYY